MPRSTGKVFKKRKEYFNQGYNKTNSESELLPNVS